MIAAIRLVVPGHPPRKDAWLKTVFSKRSGKPIRALSKSAKEWTGELKVAWMLARRPMISRGRWAMNLTIFVATKTTIDGEVFPRRDCDSAVSCVLDALQRCNALDDDMRICPIMLDREHDAKQPRTEILLRPME